MGLAWTCKAPLEIPKLTSTQIGFAVMNHFTHSNAKLDRFNYRFSSIVCKCEKYSEAIFN